MTARKNHKEKLTKVNELLKSLEIRNDLKGEFYYTYPKLFQGLFDLLTIFESDEFFFAIQMHTAANSLSGSTKNKDKITINWWSDPHINYGMLIQEIFDDYWASFLCFQHGFTKQAVEILRNTYELVINLYFLRFCEKEDDENILKWIDGEQGFKKPSDKISAVKKLEFLKEDNISPYLAKMYDLLCMATHSHKKMMTSLTVPGGPLGIKEKMMFEPFIILEVYSFWCLS